MPTPFLNKLRKNSGTLSQLEAEIREYEKRTGKKMKRIRTPKHLSKKLHLR